MPFNVHTPVRFFIALVAEYLVCVCYMVVSIIFLLLYVGICTYFWSCIDDLSSIIAESEESTDQRITMKAKLVQFIDLHRHLYKYFTNYPNEFI